MNRKISRFAPAKINLMLAITGVRADGFHDLVSLVAPLALGDEISAETGEGVSADSLECDMPGVPADETNLVMRATKIFREIVPACPPVAWRLRKRIPHGAGLGGGSSDAASALMILNEICAGAPGGKILRELAARLGSDCPLFLEEKPVVMRGRGERVEVLTENEIAALRGREFLIFKPAFGVSTAEIYGAMRAASPRFYVSENLANARISAWKSAPESEPLPLFNNMELPVFEKFVALPALFEILRERCGLAPHMSGSGSACFAELSKNADVSAAERAIRDAWGDSAFVARTEILA